jgi:uncharacterized membrane protein
MDSKLFSLIKTVSWYFSDLALTFLIAFAITRDLRQAAAIGLLQQTWELGLYYFHERIWNRVKSRRENAN